MVDDAGTVGFHAYKCYNSSCGIFELRQILVGRLQTYSTESALSPHRSNQYGT